MSQVDFAGPFGACLAGEAATRTVAPSKIESGGFRTTASSEARPDDTSIVPPKSRPWTMLLSLILLYGVPRQVRRGMDREDWSWGPARSWRTPLRRSRTRVGLHLSTRPCWMSNSHHPGQGI